MFSGIVQSVGEIVSIEKTKKAAQIVIGVHGWKPKLFAGSSIAVNGVCLTLLDKKVAKNISFELMGATLDKTTMGSAKKGMPVNLESSLRIGDEVSGHFVFGHVDDMGRIERIVSKKGNYLVTVHIPHALMQYIAPQGSVAIDGVSLTVAAIYRDSFTVSLTKFTLDNTTFGKKKVGDAVNIECDMLAKYAINRGKHYTKR